MQSCTKKTHVAEADAVEDDVPLHIFRLGTFRGGRVYRRHPFQGLEHLHRRASSGAQSRDTRRGLSEHHRAHEDREDGGQDVSTASAAPVGHLRQKQSQ